MKIFLIFCIAAQIRGIAFVHIFFRNGRKKFVQSDECYQLLNNRSTSPVSALTYTTR